MDKIVVDNCPACEPVNRLINDLKRIGFVLIEQRLEDYHFHQLYFKFSGDLGSFSNIDTKGFSKVENKFICDCHWSTIEILT